MNETQHPQNPQTPAQSSFPAPAQTPAPSGPDYRLAINLLGMEGKTRVPVNAWLWLAIGVVWILVGWLTRTPRPFLTLLATGIAGGLLTSALVIGIQLFTSGGPGLATAPFAIVSILAMHAAGGALCGLVAWGLQAATGR
jgi:hypothetical protein